MASVKSQSCLDQQLNGCRLVDLVIHFIASHIRHPQPRVGGEILYAVDSDPLYYENELLLNIQQIVSSLDLEETSTASSGSRDEESGASAIKTMKKVDNTEEYIQKTMVVASVSLGQLLAVVESFMLLTRDILALVKISSLGRFSISMRMKTRPTSYGPSLSRDPITTTWATSIIFTQLQKNNTTLITKVFLLGFQVGRNIRYVMFFLLLVVYMFTIFMNLLIITLVSTSKILQTPMYFFLIQLSINDILLTTATVPKMLHVILYYRGSITFIGCMTQLYFFGGSEASECVLLTVMSYDRYVAICNPLRYTTIMTGTYCVILVVSSWLLAIIIVSLIIITLGMLNFCGPNTIDHLFCDFLPVLELSCSETNNFHMTVYILGIPIILIPVTIIIFSYTKIIISILKISSSTGRQKAFSTCSSHLTVVSIFYWTLFGVYIFPTRGQTSTMGKILSLLYTVFTPLINPIIYSLKNNDIKKALHGLLHRRLTVRDM
ncbi:olfactory receptor 10A7-like [Leptodactylus fuscus]|uniref:olfactory receptor 10A7-like n=1 Tax=Leptodactylus fuscus TaxID=238119 RepID=UPI003F4EDDD6